MSSTQSTVIRIRTCSGVARIVLQGSLSDLTVGTLKERIVEEGVFSDRGVNFGLTVEGKRKKITLDDSTETLVSIGVVDGTMFTVDYSGGIRADIEIAEKLPKVSEDLFHLPTPTKAAKKVRRIEETGEAISKKICKSAVAIAGDFDVKYNQNMQDLVTYFFETNLGPEGTTDLGSFFFNEHIAAARLDALTAGTVLLGYIEGSNSSNESGADERRISASFSSAGGKKYLETSNCLSDEVVILLMVAVLERLSTKRRINTATARKMFSVSSLASRAPWVLWPIAKTHGPNLSDCQEALDRLLNRAYETE